MRMRLLFFLSVLAIVLGSSAMPALGAEEFESINIIGYYSELTMLGTSPGWGNIPEKMTDGKDSTYCQPVQNVGFTIRADLLGDVKVGTVAVRFFAADLTRFSVRSKAESGDWKTLAGNVKITESLVRAEGCVCEACIGADCGCCDACADCKLVKDKNYSFEFAEGETFRFLELIVEPDASAYGPAISELEIWNHSSFDPLGIPSKPVNTDSDLKFDKDFNLEDYLKTDPDRETEIPVFGRKPEIPPYAGRVSYDDKLNVAVLVLSAVMLAATAVSAVFLIRKLRKGRKKNEE